MTILVGEIFVKRHVNYDKKVVYNVYFGDSVWAEKIGSAPRRVWAEKFGREYVRRRRLGYGHFMAAFFAAPFISGEAK